VYTKICPQCKKEFTTANHRAKYCSKECSSKSMMHKKLIVCPTCGKEVLVRYSHTFCSRACADKARQGVRHTPTIVLQCPVCGKSFERSKARKKFCSRECAIIGRNKPTNYAISEDERNRRSEYLKNMWQNLEFRNSVVNRMKTNNPVHIPNVVERAKRTRLQNGTYSNNFKYGNGKISEYEQKVYAQLIFAGFYYNYAIPTKLAKDAFPDRKYPNSYKPDFVNLKTKLCIEIDGNNHRLPSIEAKDKKKEECLQFLGFSTIRFTHKDIDEGKFDLWLNSYQKDM